MAHTDPPRISVIDYDETRFEEKDVAAVQELAAYLTMPGITWINVRGLSNPELVNSIGELFKLHPLTVEDILNSSQRPKMEDLMNYVFVSVKVLRRRKESAAANGYPSGR